MVEDVLRLDVRDDPQAFGLLSWAELRGSTRDEIGQQSKRLSFGTLQPGRPADLALVRLEEEGYSSTMSGCPRPRGSVRLVNTPTIIDGEVLPCLPKRAPHPWATPPTHRRR